MVLLADAHYRSMYTECKKLQWKTQTIVIQDIPSFLQIQNFHHHIPRISHFIFKKFSKVILYIIIKHLTQYNLKMTKIPLPTAATPPTLSCVSIT